MYRSTHKIKAAVLLIVFALNTVVSFACSFGLVDLFKAHHASVEKPVQENAQKHEHSSHHHSPAAHQQHKDAEPKDIQQPEDQQDKNCCADNAVELSKTDKALPGVVHTQALVEAEMLRFVSSYLLPALLVVDLIDPKPPFDRSWDPEHHTNIRIAIQSFQI